MPTWLVHGFRWPRASIRIHVIVQNLEDCAPDWLMAPATHDELMTNLRKLYPDQISRLPNLCFIEQYDLDEETEPHQPYAYVCDQVQEISLSMDLAELKDARLPDAIEAAITELRDHIAPDARLGWYVVVNGDPERWAPPESEQDSEVKTIDRGVEEQFSPTSQRSSMGPSDDDGSLSRRTGLKNWLGKVRKTRSFRDLRGQLARKNAQSPPPLPASPPQAFPLQPSFGKDSARVVT